VLAWIKEHADDPQARAMLIKMLGMDGR
jgi:hypothetical protein